jgi:hypothetical protein
MCVSLTVKVRLHQARSGTKVGVFRFIAKFSAKFSVIAEKMPIFAADFLL